MDRKKILIVSRSFYPVNSPRSFRTTELAKEFSRQGHDVTVITHRDNALHNDFEREHNVVIKDMGNHINEIELKGKGIALKLRRAGRRIAKLLLEYPNIKYVKLVKNALKNERGYDVLISVAVPHPVHWGVAAANPQKNGIARRWIADCGDPYMGQENDSFKPPFYFKYIEKKFCRMADFITVPTVGAIQGYYPEFRDKIKVIPQGFKFDDINVFQGIPANEPITFGYAGTLIPGRRDPSELLSYLLSLKQDFRFHIFTGNVGLVKSFAEKSAGKVIIEPLIPRHELLERLSRMDFVVNFENVGEKQTPSKLIDYAIISRPVLSVKTGNLNTGVVNEFLNKDYRNQYQIENVEQYRIENVVKEFLKLG